MILPDGGSIDTPYWELAITSLEKKNCPYYFPEMLSRLQNCQYNNCVHINEPNCAIKEAVQKGEITEERYLSYINILIRWVIIF